VQEQDVPTAVAVSAPYVDYWHPWSVWNYDLFAAGFRPAPRARVRWFNGTDSILFPNPASADQQVLLILPDHIRLPSELHPDLQALLLPGSRVLETGYVDGNGSTLDLYLWQDRGALERRLQDVAAADVWSSAEGPYVAGQSEQSRVAQTLPLGLGNRLSFLGYSYSARNAASGTEWQATTYWQVIESSPDEAGEPLAIFVHALDDASTVLAGWDGLHAAVTSWQPGDVFVQVHALHLPADVPSGSYRVELGVYSPVSLERLPIYTDQGTATAPHSRLLLAPLEVH
jgi:hypothetical protein